MQIDALHAPATQMMREASRASYQNHHVPLCRAGLRGASQYCRHYLTPRLDGEEPPCDVIAEPAFVSPKVRDAVLATLARDAMPGEVIAEKTMLFDRSKSRALPAGAYQAVLNA